MSPLDESTPAKKIQPKEIIDLTNSENAVNQSPRTWQNTSPSTAYAYYDTFRAMPTEVETYTRELRLHITTRQVLIIPRYTQYRKIALPASLLSQESFRFKTILNRMQRENHPSLIITIETVIENAGPDTKTQQIWLGAFRNFC